LGPGSDIRVRPLSNSSAQSNEVTAVDG
jgi:hypothetical protein